jgi:hypothetical protein
MVMPSHHLNVYTVVEEKNACNDVKLHSLGGTCTRRSMRATHASTEDHHEPELYEIRIKGHLDKRWADWFSGLTITTQDLGETLLTGPVVDQAALHGVLRKVRDLGLPLHAAHARCTQTGRCAGCQTLIRTTLVQQRRHTHAYHQTDRRH